MLPNLTEHDPWNVLQLLHTEDLYILIQGHSLSKCIDVFVFPDENCGNTIFTFVEIADQIFKVDNLHIGNQKDIGWRFGLKVLYGLYT